MKKLIFRGGLLLFILSYNLTAQWVQCSNGMSSGSVFAFLTQGNTVYAGTNEGIYITNNNGSAWNRIALINHAVYSLAAKGNSMFAGTMSDGVYASTDDGDTWLQTSLTGLSIHYLEVKGNDIYAADFTNVFKSTDNGNLWHIVYTAQIPNIGSLASNSNNFFAGEHGVFVTSNNGANWVQTLNTGAVIVNAIAGNGNTVFAGAMGIYRSTNSGLVWDQYSLNGIYVRSLLINGSNIYAGTNNNGVYVSLNNGISWTQKSEGFNQPIPIIEAMCISDGYIYAGTWQQNIYRRPLDELTGIKMVSNEVPGMFNLSQNYPNPFNPVTRLRFDLPAGKAGIEEVKFAKLIIFDALGRETETLLNEQLNPGTYEIEWDASDYPSGVYYYRLITGDYTDTKKMILVK